MCRGVAGFLFGHKFVPVITRDAAKLPDGIRSLNGAGAIEFIAELRNETLQAIYCERCGEWLSTEDME